MDERRIMRDGRRLPPRNSRGEFRRRRSRRDRGMPYGQEAMRMHDYVSDYRGMDMANQDYDNYPVDGHYPQAHGSTYYPIQAMGTFEGYYGMPEEDYGYDMRNRDYGYDMRGRMRGRDYGYTMARGGRGGRGRGRDYGDYGYDYGDYGDYGEALSEKELHSLDKRLMEKVEDRHKGFFTKENVAQRARQHGFEMKDFGEEELLTATLMQYTDLCKYLKPFVGENLDAYIGAGYAFLVDDDTEVKGAEKLAVYYDEIVMGDKEE